MNDLKEISSFDGLSFGKEEMEYFTRYFSEYYHDGFHPDQGTEVILNVLQKLGQSGKWLDIGAGPATLFWSLMLSNISALHCSELHVEGFKVLDDFMQSQAVPQCYLDVMRMYNIPSEHLSAMREIPRKYFLFDALQEWPTTLTTQGYDLITAFGVFGLCKTPQEYQRSFSHMLPALRSGGVAIGANWIRSQYFIDQNGGDNRYLDVKLVEAAAKEYGYHIEHLSKETINDDENYDGVVVWALRKNNQWHTVLSGHNLRI